MELRIEKIKNIIKKTIEVSPQFEGDILNIDCFKMFMSSQIENIYKIMGFNVCTFNCMFQDEKAVMLIFSVPINETDGNKLITDKIIDLVDLLENSLITLDYLHSAELKEEKQIYVVVVKKVKN